MPVCIPHQDVGHSCNDILLPLFKQVVEHSRTPYTIPLLLAFCIYFCCYTVHVTRNFTKSANLLCW